MLKSAKLNPFISLSDTDQRTDRSVLKQKKPTKRLKVESGGETEDGKKVDGRQGSGFGEEGSCQLYWNFHFVLRTSCVQTRTPALVEGHSFIGQQTLTRRVKNGGGCCGDGWWALN